MNIRCNFNCRLKLDAFGFVITVFVTMTLAFGACNGSGILFLDWLKHTGSVDKGPS